MPVRLLEETREEIIRLYDGGSGPTLAEIARQTGVSYSSVSGLTRIRQRINPETGQPFESRSQYEGYTARQRVNPETGQPFESLAQLRDYRARQRVKRPENQGLSKLIKRRLEEIGRDQSWLAREIGVTKQAVSLYAQGKSFPTKGLLESLNHSLGVQHGTLDGLLE